MLALAGRPFLQEESHDHMARDEKEFEGIRHYIEENPVRAGWSSKPAIIVGPAPGRPGGRPRPRGAAPRSSPTRKCRVAPILAFLKRTTECLRYNEIEPCARML